MGRFFIELIGSKLRSALTDGRPAILTPTAAPLVPTVAAGNARCLLGTSTRRMLSLSARSTDSQTCGRTPGPVHVDALAAGFRLRGSVLNFLALVFSFSWVSFQVSQLRPHKTKVRQARSPRQRAGLAIDPAYTRMPRIETTITGKKPRCQRQQGGGS